MKTTTIAFSGSVNGTVIAAERDFSTGSQGFGYTGKVQGENGATYQVSINLVRVGSGSEPEAPSRAAAVAKATLAKAAGKAAPKAAKK